MSYEHSSNPQGQIALELAVMMLGFMAQGSRPTPEAVLGIFLERLKGSKQIDLALARETLLNGLDPEARERMAAKGLGHPQD